MKNICKPFFIAFIVSSLAGVPLHYLYDLTHFYPFSFIAPVNESVWEHIKLAVVPLVIAFYVLYKCIKPKASTILCSASLAILSSVAMIIGGHYTIVYGLGVKNPIWDILFYFVSMAIAYLIACRALRCPCPPIAVFIITSLAALLLLLVLLFTVIPPKLPIFLNE